jgi:hypothetical protein
MRGRVCAGRPEGRVKASNAMELACGRLEGPGGQVAVNVPATKVYSCTPDLRKMLRAVAALAGGARGAPCGRGRPVCLPPSRRRRSRKIIRVRALSPC